LQTLAVADNLLGRNTSFVNDHQTAALVNQKVARDRHRLMPLDFDSMQPTAQSPLFADFASKNNRFVLAEDFVGAL